MDGGIASKYLTATKCNVASVLPLAVPNPDTDDEPRMTSKEESEDERVPSHLLAPVTLDPTPEDLEAQECVRSRIVKI